MQKSFLIAILLVVAAMFGIFLLTSDGANAPGSSTYDASEVQLTDHVWGIDPVETDAELAQAIEDKVILIEYGDFQCPACASFFSVLEQLKQNFEGELVFVFRHFPLISIHPQAMAGHRAAEAAAMQGKFWEMHDLLYGRIGQWSGDPGAATTFAAYAQEINLDMEKYAQDVNSAEVGSKISADQRSASEFRVNSTPTMIINGERVQVAPTYETMSQLIEQALES